MRGLTTCLFKATAATIGTGAIAAGAHHVAAAPTAAASEAPTDLGKLPLILAGFGVLGLVTRKSRPDRSVF